MHFPKIYILVLSTRLGHKCTNVTRTFIKMAHTASLLCKHSLGRTPQLYLYLLLAAGGVDKVEDRSE